MFSKMNYLVIIALVAMLAACGSSSNNGGGTSLVGDPAKVLGTVNNVPITEKEVMEAIRPNLKSLEMEIYKMEKSGLDQVIDKKLLEEAAKKDGKSVEKYLETYFANNMKDPTDDEIQRYYEFRKEQMGGKGIDEVKGQIKAFLTSNQKNALEKKLAGSLRVAAKVSVNLEPPRVEIDLGDAPSKGKKGAPVTIVEFTDYQCPFCGRVRETVNKIMETYPNDVYYVLKDNPLSFHKDSPKAHEAALCAGEQGKYWEMSQELFANQKALSVEDLKKYAKTVGLNTDKFNKCLDGGQFTKQVQDNVQQGASVGVTGTPAFFVNGVLISGARPFEDFKATIDDELSRKK